MFMINNVHEIKKNTNCQVNAGSEKIKEKDKSVIHLMPHYCKEMTFKKRRPKVRIHSPVLIKLHSIKQSNKIITFKRRNIGSIK